MPDHVFYSWQSDRPNATNRSLIQAALESATKRIRADQSLDVEPVVDRDTAGAPGSPDIARTIFDKIQRAAVFVADVTHINDLDAGVVGLISRFARGAAIRTTPNPNVLVELGYAA